jgi:CRP/FNR family transcriptional regulator, anaerobic regulatory protein
MTPSLPRAGFRQPRRDDDETMTKRAILEKFAFYRQLPKTDQLALFDSAREVALPAGADFCREGDEAAQFALVGSGDIRVFKTSLTGREITLYHVQEGEACLVNMLSVFLARPAMVSAQIEVAVEAVVIPAAVFRALVGSSGTVREFVFEAMAVRLIDVMTLTEEIAFRRMDERLAAYLQQRFCHRGAGSREIAVTHEEIAQELGTAREVVSRLLKELEHAGALRLARGSIELRDDAALRRAGLRARGS